MSNLADMARQPAGEGAPETSRSGRAAETDAPFQVVVDNVADERPTRRPTDRDASRRSSDRNPGRRSADDNPSRRTAVAEDERRAASPPAARPAARRRSDSSTRTQAPVAPPVPAAKLDAGRLAVLGVLGFLMVVVGAVAGYVESSMSPDRYGARAEVYYEISQEKATGFLREDRSLTTQLVLAHSRAVLEPVATANGMTVDELSSQLSVSLLGSSELIRLQVEDASPERALALVEAVVTQYLTLTREQGTDNARQYLETQMSQLETLVDAQRDKIEVLSAQTTNPQDGNVLAARSELESLLTRQDAIAEQLDQLTVGQMTQQRIDLLTPGYVLADPVSPRPKVAAVTGALAAAVLAAVLVALIGRRWSRR